MTIKFRAAAIAAACVCAVSGWGGANALGVSTSPAAIVEPLPPVAESAIVPGDGIATDLPVIAQGKPTLAALVQANADGRPDDPELNCLAIAVYFEAKGEPLAGQLAVAEVILNRVRSGRFASTVCGVVRQPSQFSFVHRGGLPAMGDTPLWRRAIGVARVAFGELYAGPAPQAMYFHARRVAPNWGKREVAAVGNHIFYR